MEVDGDNSLALALIPAPIATRSPISPLRLSVSAAPLRITTLRACSPPPGSRVAAGQARWLAMERRRGAAPFASSSSQWLMDVPQLHHRFRAQCALTGGAAHLALLSPVFTTAIEERRERLITALLRVAQPAPARETESVRGRRAASDDRSLDPMWAGPRRAAAAAPLRQPAPAFPFVALPPHAVSQFLPHRAAWRSAIEPWYRNPSALLAQIDDGVRLGYNGPRSDYLFRDNHASAELPIARPVVDKEFLDELRAGRMAGPFTAQQIRQLLPFFRTSPMAVVPKPDGGGRIIDDLTHDDGSALNSVNAHIPDEAAEVRYHRFDRAIRIVRQLGPGCWLAKVDWKSAFRQIAVHRDDWPLLGLFWRGHYFVRLVLPFGARSSPARFTDFAQAFAGILRRRFEANSLAALLMFYLDDFLMAARSEAECAKAVEMMDALATLLGVTLHPTKRDGPAQIIVFLGIGVDTVRMRVFLPADKKAKVLAACRRVLRARRASVRQLQSLIGLLLHAAQVVQPGRLMTRRLLEVQTAFMRAAHSPRVPRPLPDDALDDLQWWVEGLDAWDGQSMIPSASDAAEPIVIQSDASSEHGAGAVLFLPPAMHAVATWFFLDWRDDQLPAAVRQWHIGALEMLAIAVALHTFGAQLATRCIRIHSDSMNAVQALQRQASTSWLHMRLLRAIHAAAWAHDIHITLTSHIAGKRNVYADAASRLPVQTADHLASLGLAEERRLQPLLPAWLAQLAQHWQQRQEQQQQ